MGEMEERRAGLTDAELMQGLAKGNTILLGELYRRYDRRVKGALATWVPEMAQADIEDTSQEVFIALGKTAKRYDERSKFKAWLYRIASRKAIDWRRKRWVRRRFLGRKPENIAMALRQEHNSPAARTGLRETVAMMLSKLTSEQRKVIWLHFVEGFDGDEIASILGVRRSTVYTRMHRARAVLLKSVDAESWKDILREGEL
ncbi:MAG: sigma-70 family RNA polymerase sigma factor [Deltaproteobacteria bacterium]|nr:sigma-70 family RNA polymerase sigma factor [Deltaproteobacteria bacterium]